MNVKNQIDSGLTKQNENNPIDFLTSGQTRSIREY